mgnify:CR=1 FL=1
MELGRCVRLALLVGLTLCVGSSCDDDATTPDRDPFALEVVVRDVDGVPVEGLEVVVWNLSSSLEEFLQDEFFRRRAVTVVQFRLPEEARCLMTLSDVAGNEVQTFIDGDVLPAGVHQIALGPDLRFEAGVEIFRYELVVRDQNTDAELFRDAKWMTAVLVDREALDLRSTDMDGRWRTNDLSFVPGLVHLDEIVATNEVGEEQGRFTLGDEVVIRVVGADGAFQQTTTVVGTGRNVVEFTWDVPLPEVGVSGGFEGAATRSVRTDAIGPDATYELRQNFPNPFN